jgi:glyoxylase-like metal-dependent hydrolase (beta-lactamase superfamily II)
MDSQFYRFTLGDFQCVSLLDGSLDYALEHFVKNAPKEQVQAYLQAHNLPTGHITTPYAYLYAETGQNRLLVDMGAGMLAPTTGKLLESMALAGIDPNAIDSVFITHAHPDHVGGTLDETGNLNFPNAQYYIWKEEWNFWFSEGAEPLGPMFVHTARRALRPLQGRVTLVDHEDELLPGVRLLAAPGHTPGHAVAELSSGEEKLYYTADTVLYPFHLEHTNWLPVYDILPESAAPSKRRIFDLVADQGALVLGQHFPPFPNLGHVVRQGEGWRWEPI